jgi:hypothetical protein
MSLFSLFQRKDPLQRPLDKAIADHKAMLKKWESKQQKEIVAALLQAVFPAHHLRHNPTKKG